MCFIVEQIITICYIKRYLLIEVIIFFSGPNHPLCFLRVYHILINMRLDHQIIASWIEPKSSVLELCCGEGDLLYYLKHNKQATVEGVEPLKSRVECCYEKGLSVLQGGINTDECNYPDDCYDYIILSQSLQQIQDSLNLIEALLCIGRKVIIRFPNCGHWSIRLKLFNTDHIPRRMDLSVCDIRALTINNFTKFIGELGADIIRTAAIKAADNKRKSDQIVKILPNLFATYGIFMIGKKNAL